jgi:aminoglycoside 2'-N-acetyltransferase I
MPELRIAPTDQLSQEELRLLRAMLEQAFEGTPEGGLTEEDWEHTLGGVHVLAVDNSTILSHAAIVERSLTAGERSFRTGYVEGVATSPSHRRRGYASLVMREVGRLIQDDFELGALATGVSSFYLPLGWELWHGPTWASFPAGPQRTPDEDGAVMILRTDHAREVDSTGSLICDWRAGEVW